MAGLRESLITTAGAEYPRATRWEHPPGRRLAPLDSLAALHGGQLRMFQGYSPGTSVTHLSGDMGDSFGPGRGRSGSCGAMSVKDTDALNGAVKAERAFYLRGSAQVEVASDRWCVGRACSPSGGAPMSPDRSVTHVPD